MEGSAPARGARRSSLGRALPRIKVVDVLALSYAGVIVAYALLPQGLLDGGATARGELLALRHHLLPVAAYALGRLVSRLWQERSRLGGAIVLAAVVVAVAGLVDLAVLSLQSWRDSGVPGWYREHLDLDYEGLSGLPENWVYNTGDEESPMRRLVATLLSPLASAYVLVVALVYVVSRRLTIWWGLLALLLYVGLLYTHTRAALAALAVGLVLLALAQRRVVPAVLAAVSVAAGGVPRRVPDDRTLDELHGGGARVPAPERRGGAGGEHGSPVAVGVVDRQPPAQPAGRNAGRARASAGVRPRERGRRRQEDGVEIKAGESTYTEIGIDAGIAGMRLPPLEPRPARGAAAPRGLARRRIRGRAPARPADGRHRRPLARRRAVGGRGGRARLATPGAPGSRGGRDGGRARAGPEPAAPSPDA